LEDIFVGNRKISKGSILYGQISGFSMQRVDLTIVSVFTKGEIYPVNLSIYDVDGMKGLYVPQSVFRDMIRKWEAIRYREPRWIWADKDFLPASVPNYLLPLPNPLPT
jgi:hypothetical protein